MKPIRLSPFLDSKLVSSSRYFREEFLKQSVPGPMAWVFVGGWLHRAIVKALKGKEVPSFRWPRRVVLNEGEDLGRLEAMAKDALEVFKDRYLAPLKHEGAVAEERLEVHLKNLGQPVVLTGRVDARWGVRSGTGRPGTQRGRRSSSRSTSSSSTSGGRPPYGPGRWTLTRREHVEPWDERLVGRVLHRVQVRPQPGGHRRFCPRPELPQGPLVNTWTRKVTELARWGTVK